MTNRSSPRALGATLLLVVACQALAGPQAREPFEAELARLAGRDARQCGIFALARDAKAGWACVQAAERAGQPYWLAFEGGGDDSLVGHAAIRTAAGTHILLDYDSSPWGRGLYPHFVTTTCPWPVTYDPSPGNRFDCAPPVPGR